MSREDVLSQPIRDPVELAKRLVTRGALESPSGPVQVARITLDGVEWIEKGPCQ